MAEQKLNDSLFVEAECIARTTVNSGDWISACIFRD